MSDQSISILSLPVVATAAITKNRFVTAAGALCVADANAFGVSRSDTAIGERFTVDVLGTSVIESGAAFAVGATLKSDATGRAITWATAGAKIALALQPATAAGQFVEILLIPNVA